MIVDSFSFNPSRTVGAGDKLVLFNFPFTNTGEISYTRFYKDSGLTQPLEHYLLTGNGNNMLIIMLDGSLTENKLYVGLQATVYDYSSLNGDYYLQDFTDENQVTGFFKGNQQYKNNTYNFDGEVDSVANGSGTFYPDKDSGKVTSVGLDDTSKWSTYVLFNLSVGDNMVKGQLFPNAPKGLIETSNASDKLFNQYNMSNTLYLEFDYMNFEGDQVFIPSLKLSRVDNTSYYNRTLDVFYKNVLKGQYVMTNTKYNSVTRGYSPVFGFNLGKDEKWYEDNTIIIPETTLNSHNYVGFSVWNTQYATTTHGLDNGVNCKYILKILLSEEVTINNIVYHTSTNQTELLNQINQLNVNLTSNLEEYNVLIINDKVEQFSKGLICKSTFDEFMMDFNNSYAESEGYLNTLNDLIAIYEDMSYNLNLLPYIPKELPYSKINDNPYNYVPVKDTGKLTPKSAGEDLIKWIMFCIKDVIDSDTDELWVSYDETFGVRTFLLQDGMKIMEEL
jgi:hypothetical protein